jgi:hypothetical protein
MLVSAKAIVIALAISATAAGQAINGTIVGTITDSTGGAIAHIFGGWQVSGILTVMTGQALNISALNATLNAPGNSNNPDYLGSGSLPISGDVNFRATGRDQATWFDTALFRAPAANRFGNVGRNAFANTPQ